METSEIKTHLKCDHCLLIKPNIEVIDCDNCFMNQCVDCLSKQTDYTKCMFCHLSTFKSSSLSTETDDVDIDDNASDEEDKTLLNSYINDSYFNNSYINNDPYINNPVANNALKFLSPFSLFQTTQTEEHTEKFDKPSEKFKLYNNCNSCYINCIVQIFLHSEQLFKGLMTLKTSDNFLVDIRKQYCNFAGITTFEQCDATFFLNWIFDKLENDNKEWSQKWITVRTCLQCNHKTLTHSHQNFWYVYPHENDQAFVDDDGKKYDCDMAESIMNQDQDYIEKKCDQCKINTKHKQVSTLQNFPNNLFFNFQQFKEKQVYIYQDIDLTVFEIDETSKKSTNKKEIKNYILKGIVCHKGTQNFGHYTVYLKDQDGWYHYDDSRITQVRDIEEILATFQYSRSFPLLWYTVQDEQ